MGPKQSECLTCREEIRPGARKCTKCDSFQDWRRFLVVSTSALALVIALVSVTSALGPGIIRMFQKDESKLVISYLAAVDEGILLLASNTGTRPAVVHGASLASRPDFIHFSLKSGGDREHILIDSGKVQAITIVPKVVGLPEGAYAKFNQEESQQIYVHATQFGGIKDTVPLAIPRSDLFPHVLEGKDFIGFQKALLDPYTEKHPELLANISAEAIDRIEPAVLDRLSPELVAHLKRVRAANRPKTLMER